MYNVIMVIRAALISGVFLFGPWQVVSEVLFPTVDPSPGQKDPVLLGSSPCAASEPPQSSVPPRTAHNSMEVISQLLREAEGDPPPLTFTL